MRLLPFALALTLAPLAGFANLDVRFVEGAPKDRFVFENNGSCEISDAVLELDLSGSAAGLIFDVTGQGAGVEVFQPLEITQGRTALTEVPDVRDGDTGLRFDLQGFAPGDVIAFTIDVDDTMAGREITVSTAEIMGARVVLSGSDARATADFGPDARASLRIGGCDPAT